VQVCLALAFCLCCCIVWQMPVASAAPASSPMTNRKLLTALPSDSTNAADAAGGPAPMQDHEYGCQQGVCNLCHFRAEEVEGNPKPFADGSSAQERINGTRVRRSELEAEGIEFLQVGGDWWNKCGDGWLNVDFIFTRLPVGVLCQDWRTGRHIMRLNAGSGLPFESGSFAAVYSEHMFEHILPMEGASFLREAYRVLRPGGVIRVTTPDLEKYLNGYVNRATDTFLADHAKRFPPMGKLGQPYTAATVVNNIFRNYEHRWIYDFEEIVRTAQVAGIPSSAVRRSSRLGDDLPDNLVAAIKRTETPSTARHQATRRENPTRCWLEQEVRAAESIYVTIHKPLE